MTTKPQKVYISGSISKDLYGFFDKFLAADKFLRELGYRTFNPAMRGHDPHMPHSWYMRRDVVELANCDLIYMIEGWEESKGARAELYIANLFDIDIIDDNGEINTIERSQAELICSAMLGIIFMNEWKQYKRKGLSELLPVEKFETLEGISVSEEDRKNGSPKKGDMIARNPKNHDDKWLVAKKYFEDNLEPASE